MPVSPAPAELKTDEAEPVPLHLAYRVCEDIARTHYENSPSPPASSRRNGGSGSPRSMRSRARRTTSPTPRLRARIGCARWTRSKTHS